MPKDAAKRLVDFLERQAGEYLRGVLHYSADDFHLLYLRDDLTDEYSDADLEALRSYYHRENTAQGDEPFALGNHHCSAQFYDEAILLHFMQGEGIGTVITLDPAAGRDMVTFITRCLKQLHLNSPQHIDAAPTWLQE